MCIHIGHDFLGVEEKYLSRVSVIGLLWEEMQEGSCSKAAFRLGRGLGKDGGKRVMAAVDIFKGLLWPLWKWRISYLYSKKWGGVCFIRLREY